MSWLSAYFIWIENTAPSDKKIYVSMYNSLKAEGTDVVSLG